MKKALLLALTTLTLLLCTTSIASAYPAVVHADYEVHISMDETIPLVVPDFSSLCGENVTIDDFDVTILSQLEHLGEGRGSIVLDHETMTLSVLPDAADKNYIHNYILCQYKPKVKGKGVETDVYFKVYPHPALEKLELTATEITMAVGEKHSVRYDVTKNIRVHPELTVDGSSVTAAQRKYETYSRTEYYLDFTAEAVGDTVLTLTGYNGLSTSLTIHVLPAPETFSIEQDFYTKLTTETLTIDYDLGGTQMHTPLKWECRYIGGPCSFSGGIATNCFSDDGKSFITIWNGRYRCTATTYNGLTDSCIIEVYNPNVAELKMTADATGLTIGKKVLKATIELIDAATGYDVYVPLTISGDEGVIELDQLNMRVTPLKEGTATITATTPDGKQSQSITFTVSQMPNTMELNVTEKELAVGESFDLLPIFDTGSISVNYYSNAKITLDGQTQKLVSITPDGHVTARAPGIATISVYDLNRDFTQTCTVHIQEQQTDKILRIVHPEGYLGIHHTFQLTVQDANGTVYPATFTKSVSSGFDLTEDGLMTGKSYSNYDMDNVFATLEDGHVISYCQNVIAKPEKIWFEGDVNLPVDTVLTSYDYPDVYSDAGELQYGRDVTVAIGNTSIAIFDGSYLRPLKMGSTTLTVTSKTTGAQATTRLIITEPNKIYLPQQRYYMAVDSTLRLPGYVLDYYGNQIPCTYKLTEGVYVMSNGYSTFSLSGNVLKCRKDHYAKIKATTEDGRSATISIETYTLPKKTSMVEAAVTLKIGEEYVVEVDNVYNYVEFDWRTTSSRTIGFVGEPDGNKQRIVALKAGTAKVIAELPNDVACSCTITVIDETAEPVAPTSLTIKLANDSHLVTEGTSHQLLVTYTPGNADKALRWAVSNPAAGKIDEDGVFTAAKGLKRHQTVTVTATSVSFPEISASYTFTVMAKNVTANPGDANQDDVIDLNDLLLILQHDAGWGVTLNRDNADVNGDGAVNALDALSFQDIE